MYLTLHISVRHQKQEGFILSLTWEEGFFFFFSQVVFHIIVKWEKNKTKGSFEINLIWIGHPLPTHISVHFLGL